MFVRIKRECLLKPLKLAFPINRHKCVEYFSTERKSVKSKPSILYLKKHYAEHRRIWTWSGRGSLHRNLFLEGRFYSICEAQVQVQVQVRIKIINKGGGRSRGLVTNFLA